MGNTVSCCCRANPGDRQEEEQRSRHEGIQSQQTSVEILEGGSVTPGTTSADSSDSPLVTNDEGTSQSKPDQPLETLQQVKPTASIVVTNVHVDAASAVDKSILRYQQEQAAEELVTEALTSISEIVAFKYLDQVTGKGVSFTVPHATAVATNVQVKTVSDVDRSTFLKQQEAAAELVSKVLADATEIVASKYQTEAAAELVSKVLADATEIVASKYQTEAAAELVSKVLADATEIVASKYQTEAAAELVSKVLADATEIVTSKYQTEIHNASTLILHKKLESRDMSTLMETQDMSNLMETQAMTIVTERECTGTVIVAATVLESQTAVSQGIESTLPSVAAEKVVRAEIRGSAADSAPHAVFGLSTASSLGNLLEGQETPERSLIPKQDKIRLESKSLPPAKLIKWVVFMERPESLGPVTIPAVKLENRLVQNPSAEEEVNEAPKGVSLATEIDAQLDRNVQSKSVPFAKLYTRFDFMERPESLGCSLKVPKATPLMTPMKEALSELHQLMASLEGLGRNSSAEEVMNEVPKGHSTSPYSEGDLYHVPEQDGCSFGPPVGISVYSESKWKGQTTKSIIIRKGYAVLSQSFGFLRRVRGDNYCALRASLYQALMHTTRLPGWLQHKSILLIPEQLESHHGLIKGWLLPDICKHTSGIENAVGLMKCYLRLLQNWWHAAAASRGVEGRRSVCEQLFQGGEDEFGVMEALKLLMLAHAVDLQTVMQRGDNVPIFCWLLFARDTSSSPRSYLANHLSQVGFSRGMEQVDMFLLGCAMRHTIKVYRLHMAETEEFISHYPDDSIQDWPCVCLVTKDDRHYDVAFGNPVCSEEDLSGESD